MNPTDTLGPRFDEALAYAARAHRDQRRKGGPIPYVAHLLAVAGLVIEGAAEDGELTEDLAIAALLHDVVEDQGGHPRLDDVRRRFGDEVARMVEACSDSTSTEPSQKAPWRARKEHHLAMLERADRAILRVVVADKLHNARSILADHRRYGEALWQRFNPEADQVWYLRAAAELLGRRLGGPQAAELGRVADSLAATVSAASSRP